MDVQSGTSLRNLDLDISPRHVASVVDRQQLVYHTNRPSNEREVARRAGYSAQLVRFRVDAIVRRATALFITGIR